MSTSVNDCRSVDFLRGHIASIMAFYHPDAIDPNGGFFQYFRDDGSIYDAGHRHLVSSARFVFNYAMAWLEFGDDAYREAVRHGVDYLRQVHYNPANGSYVWTLRDGEVEDDHSRCYGIAFVLLAYSCAHKVGIDGAARWMDDTWDLLEQHFWEPAAGLYRDEADADWQFSDYRGQNANMHMCEAMLAAFEASGEQRYLDRAVLLAEHMTRTQAAKAGGLIWEHYDRDWNVDWDYNRDKPNDLFKPWGFQPGHQTEWAKLLMLIARYRPLDWLAPTAVQLFDSALAKGWDDVNGGIYYGVAPDGSVCAADKYFWVQSETLACAALLAEHTGETRFWQWYERLWQYAWAHLVDHRYGAWYRIVSVDNRKYDDKKSPAGKTGYHPMGACHDVLKVLRRQAGD